MLSFLGINSVKRDIKNLKPIFVSMFILLMNVLVLNQSAIAQGGESIANGYFYAETITVDGKSFDAIVINGPPEPPPGYELQRAPAKLPAPRAGYKRYQMFLRSIGVSDVLRPRVLWQQDIMIGQVTRICTLDLQMVE